MYRYRKGVTTGRPMAILWQDNTGATIDFSTGWTFAAFVVNERVDPLDLLHTKSTGITGSSGSLGYNVLIDWAPADFTPLPAPTIDTVYDVTVVATPTVGDPMSFPGRAQFILEPVPA